MIGSSELERPEASDSSAATTGATWSRSSTDVTTMISSGVETDRSEIPWFRRRRSSIALVPKSMQNRVVLRSPVMRPVMSWRPACCPASWGEVAEAIFLSWALAAPVKKYWWQAALNETGASQRSIPQRRCCRVRRRTSRRPAAEPRHLSRPS